MFQMNNHIDIGSRNLYKFENNHNEKFDFRKHCFILLIQSYSTNIQLVKQLCILIIKYLKEIWVGDYYLVG